MNDCEGGGASVSDREGGGLLRVAVRVGVPVRDCEGGGLLRLAIKVGASAIFLRGSSMCPSLVRSCC